MSRRYRPCPECGCYGDHHPLCPNMPDEPDEPAEATPSEEPEDETKDET